MITGSFFLSKIKTKEQYIKLKENYPKEFNNLKEFSENFVKEYALHKEWSEEYADTMFEYYYNILDRIEEFEK